MNFEGVLFSSFLLFIKGGCGSGTWDLGPGQLRRESGGVRVDEAAMGPTVFVCVREKCTEILEPFYGRQPFAVWSHQRHGPCDLRSRTPPCGHIRGGTWATRWKQKTEDEY